ncbi:MAG: DUF2235 domain-containing protein [Reyranella sp.]|uniref:DUF2235 domain-containing protein n=1 Tax=Reyranella sp. TaxID=1929291 RepID=UPI001229CD97|nr:DUF2235 domain-containing protein [Reyranella sp.]TAJ98086.1 MAG: DUF2235 domain-containing protein [Reyranella sp.]TBR29559.1 MAG: DUF2235 domain-containing protein [Reyranella sp.]
MTTQRSPGSDGMPLPKRLILLLDGTWNNWESGDNDTNIVRLEDLIAASLATDQGLPQGVDAQESTPASPSEAGGKPMVSAFRTKDERENFVYYQRGVGTGYADRISGGIWGQGLTENIRRAYKFLSFNYTPGDEIFIFGFSRGAYTARSVIGYVAAAGLLQREHCSRKLEALAWKYYRTAPADRLPATWTTLTPFVHDRAQLRIALAGLFDTVGALGVPLELLRTRNRQKYAFHDVNLSSITHVNLHAMAIDEHRKPFGATIWRKPRFKKYTSKTEQVWFAGAHADIGGGYVSARHRRGTMALDDIPLDWMMKRVRAHYPDFPLYEEAWGRVVGSEWATAEQHDSRGPLYKVFRFAFRTVFNIPIGRAGFWKTVVSHDRRDIRIGEHLHISVIERLGEWVSLGKGWTSHYRPRNVLRVLKRIQDTYENGKNDDKENILLVDWSGKILLPEDYGDRSCVIQALDASIRRLKLAKVIKSKIPDYAEQPSVA